MRLSNDGVASCAVFPSPCAAVPGGTGVNSMRAAAGVAAAGCGAATGEVKVRAAEAGRATPAEEAGVGRGVPAVAPAPGTIS